jgi:hypothetical protein
MRTTEGPMKPVPPMTKIRMLIGPFYDREKEVL